MGGYAGYAHAREARKAFMERLAERGHDVWLDMDVLYGLYESHVELRLEIGARVLRVPSGYRLWNGDIEATAEPLLANHSFDFILARFSPYFRKPELAVEAGAVAEFTKNGAVRLREDFEAAVRRACSALLIRAELADEALGRQCLGRTAFLDKDFEEAERELRRAVELEPDCAAAWSDLAAALAKLDRDEDALEAARRAIALDGDCGPALFNAAWLLAKRLERPAEAAGFYERALRQGMSGDDDLEEALHYGG
jgi:tetratricopeptide (TPR) repeat protein